MNMFVREGYGLHFEWLDHGHQDTLFFIHALGSDYRIWNKIVRLLSPHANTIAVDLRGHGLSDHRVAYEGLSDYADDCLELMDHLGVRAVIPVGLSIGGMITMIMAARRSFPKIVLADTCYKIGHPSIWNERIDIVRNQGLADISSVIVSRWFAKKYQSIHPDEKLVLKAILDKTPKDGYIQAVAAIRDADLSALLPHLNIPALCIVGTEDVPTTPSEVKQLADQLPQGQFKLIQEAAHMPCLDQPVEFAASILKFLQE